MDARCRKLPAGYYFKRSVISLATLFIMIILDISDLHNFPLQASTAHPFYTFIVFHFPFLNKIKATIVIKVSAAGIEIKTPLGPISRYLDKKYARGI